MSLADLVRFWGDPVKGFLGRDGVDVALPADEDQPEDALPVEIDSLAQWAVGDRVLSDLLAGLDPDVVKQREWRRGELPPGQLGWRMLGQILDRAGAAPRGGRRAAHHRRRGRSTSPSTSATAAGCVGTVPEVYGDRLVSVTYSRLGAKHRLASWVRLLALAASDDDRNWTAHTIGRPHSRSRDAVAASLLGPLDHTARRRAARPGRAARPRAARAAAAAAEGVARLRPGAAYPRRRARRAGEGGLRLEGRPVPRRAVRAGRAEDLGTARRAARGRASAPAPGEEFPGETGRFGALAMRVWSPLFEAEQGSW